MHIFPILKIRVPEGSGVPSMPGRSVLIAMCKGRTRKAADGAAYSPAGIK